MSTEKRKHRRLPLHNERKEDRPLIMRTVSFKGRIMQGKIIRGVGGFYYVDAGNEGIYECRAKGIFRKLGKKPLVGDDVTFEITCLPDMEGNITSLLPRRNELFRPAAANVDQALVLFALHSPDPNLMLLDRFLIEMDRQGVPSAILFNKEDLGDEEEKETLRGIYRDSGHELFFSCLEKGVGLDQIKTYLQGKTTLLAGPSGVGKSTLTNACQSAVHMETGEISRKLMRGKNTTRHAELIAWGETRICAIRPGLHFSRHAELRRRISATTMRSLSLMRGNAGLTAASMWMSRTAPSRRLSRTAGSAGCGI